MSLFKLPNELLGMVAEYLSTDDFFNLALTCQSLKGILYNNSSCRRILQKVAYSDEATEAECTGEYARGLRRYVKRREAVRAANPFLVFSVACVDNFIYTNGLLCYTTGSRELRVMNLWNSANDDLLFDVPTFLEGEILGFDGKTAYTFKPLFLAFGVVSCLYSDQDSMQSCLYHDTNRGGSSWLVILNITDKKVLSCHELRATTDIFVRNTAEHLLYGVRERDHLGRARRWTFRHLDIKHGSWTGKEITLPLAGSEIGKEVCFEIFGNFLYAVSNVRRTSTTADSLNDFYTIFRFPVNNPMPERLERPPKRNAWRRHAREGTIDERWNSLQLIQDEESGKKLIVECRREYRPSSSQPQRICYTKELSFSWDYREGELPGGAATVDEQSYCPIRPPSAMHMGDDGSQGTLLPLSDCFVRYYNASCRSFVDLVNVTRHWLEQPELRLRVRASQNNRTTIVHCPLEQSGQSIEEVEALRQIVGFRGGLEWAADERTIIYRNYGETARPLRVISFDPSLRFHGPLMHVADAA